MARLNPSAEGREPVAEEAGEAGEGAVPTITMREATEGDLDALVALYRELTGGAPVLDGAAGLERLREILAHPGTHLFGAEVGGRLVSVATLHVCPNLTFGGRPYARIENVVTAQSHRGLGLATQVMTAAMGKARSHDVVSVVLLTGKALNARGFYERLGFNAEDKWGMIWRP
jgi:ribosomal protein S18 acetylase RimI-like enzyme